MILNFPDIQHASPTTDFDQRVCNFLSEWFNDVPTVNVQTSGSTGEPKIFAIEKERMRHSARMTCDILGLQPGDTALLCLPVEYISGKMMVVRAAERSLTLQVRTPSSAPLAGLTETVDFCALTPLQVENSLAQLHLIRKLIIGGAAVSHSLKNKIHQTLRGSETRIYETYGMSETLSHIALKEIYPKPAEEFTVLQGVQISVDARGCLQIFAPHLHAERLTTNDLVELKSPSTFTYLGRIDNVINSAGLKIFPEQLESLVKKEIDNEVAFLGVPDDILGQKLVLTVEGDRNNSLEEILSAIAYPTKNHAPKQTVFLKEFPRTPNGKINRRELLALIHKEQP